MTATSDIGRTARARPEALAAKVVMIGAGQLAELTYRAALDYRIGLHVLAATRSDPAVAAGAEYTIGTPRRYPDLVAAGRNGTVTTISQETVPLVHLWRLEREGFVLRPHAKALAITADRLELHNLLPAIGETGVPVPQRAPITRQEDVFAFAGEHGWPVLLKARESGYGSRNTRIFVTRRNAQRVLGENLGNPRISWIAERHIEVATECVVLVARNSSGQSVTYPPIATHGAMGLYRELTIPAELPEAIVQRSSRLAESLLSWLEVSGIGAVTFLVSTQGEVFINEVALRPHHFGDLTLEACTTSQFHQHLRGILDWKLAPAGLKSPAATVYIPNDGQGNSALLHRARMATQPGTTIHLYGGSRPNGVVGHVTATGPSSLAALEQARAVATMLNQRS